MLFISSWRIRSIFIFWLAFFPGFSHADIRSATGNPLPDFYTVWGAVASVRALKDFCNDFHPELKTNTDKAFLQWRDRYRTFRYKIENYHSAISKIEFGVVDDSVRYQSDAIAFEKQKNLMRDLISQNGKEATLRTCLNYPEYMRSEKADFERYYSEHMDVFESYWRSKRK